MKKIFTLLFSVGILSAAAFAQPGSRDNRDKPTYDERNTQPNSQRDNNGYSNGRDVVGYDDRYDNDDRYSKVNGYFVSSMEMQIAKINRKYDFQVQRVKNDRFMRRFEKTRMIRSLEIQRQQEIRMLYARSGHKTWKADRRYDSNRY